MCVKRDNDKFQILSLYMDDILLARNDKEYIVMVKSWSSFIFEMKDMGEGTYILGVNIT